MSVYECFRPFIIYITITVKITIIISFVIVWDLITVPSAIAVRTDVF